MSESGSPPESAVAAALRNVGVAARDVRDGRSPDMGERWNVTEINADQTIATDPATVVITDAAGNELSRAIQQRGRRRSHLTLRDAVADYLAVLGTGGLAKLDHTADGRNGAMGSGPLSPLELAVLVLTASTTAALPPPESAVSSSSSPEKRLS